MNLTFNGINNVNLDLILSTSNHLSLPRKRIEMHSIPGRTGDLITWDGSRENLEVEVVFNLKNKSKENITAIDNWLNGTSGYAPLVFSDGIKFLAVVISQIDIESIAKYYGEMNVRFSCKPYEGER